MNKEEYELHQKQSDDFVASLKEQARRARELIVASDKAVLEHWAQKRKTQALAAEKVP